MTAPMDKPSDPTPSAAKPAGVRVLRCLDPACNALLPFEVEADGTLLLDLRDCARQSGDVWYFPCPRCGGKNILEIPPSAGGKPRVARFEPGSPQSAAAATSTTAEQELLTWIPEEVRKKLDRAGVKLHLAQWQALPVVERARLTEIPCETPEEAALFRTYLQNVLARAGAGTLEPLPRASDGSSR